MERTTCFIKSRVKRVLLNILFRHRRGYTFESAVAIELLKRISKIQNICSANAGICLFIVAMGLKRELLTQVDSAIISKTDKWMWRRLIASLFLMKIFLCVNACAFDSLPVRDMLLATVIIYSSKG